MKPTENNIVYIIQIILTERTKMYSSYNTIKYRLIITFAIIISFCKNNL